MKTTAGGFCFHPLTRLAIFVMVVVTLCAPLMEVDAFAVVLSSTKRCTSTKTTTKSAQQRGSFPLELLSNNKGPTTTTTLTTSRLFAAEGSSLEEDNQENKEVDGDKAPNLKFLLDPGTKGGAVFLSILLFLVPIVFYNIFVTVNTDVDPLDAGKWIGAGFTILATLAWVSTYIFRVATKDMTYAKQLKDYENAVIAKRLEELDEDELQALVEEVERDDF